MLRFPRMPFGAVRQLWQPEALANLQPEIDRAEKWAAELGREPCQSLIRRFATPGEAKQGEAKRD